MTGPGYGCALGDESHQVNWLITRLRPAVTISLCDDDFPVGLIPLLAAELGVDQARLYDTIKRFTDREQAREAKQHTQADADQDEAQAAQLEVDDHNDPGTDHRLPGREDEYDAEGRPISADLT